MGKYKKYKRKKYKREKEYTKFYPAITNMERLTEEEKELIHPIILDDIMSFGIWTSDSHPPMLAMYHKNSTFCCLHCDFLFTVEGNYRYAQCPRCFNFVSSVTSSNQKNE